MAVGRADGRRGVRRYDRPPADVRPGQGPQARVQTEARGVAVVHGGVRPADVAVGRHRRPAAGQAQAGRGTDARHVEDRPAVPQRAARVPERRAVPTAVPARRGPRVRPARVRVRPQRRRRPLARGRGRVGGPAGPRLRTGPRRRGRRPRAGPGGRVPGLRAPGHGHRRAGPVPRHVVHGQAEGPGDVPQAGRQPARGAVGRGRVAGQGQRAQVAGHAGRPPAHGARAVPGRPAQGFPEHVAGGRPQPQAGHDAQGAVRRRVPRRLLQTEHPVPVRRIGPAGGRDDHRTHGRQVPGDGSPFCARPTPNPDPPERQSKTENADDFVHKPCTSHHVRPFRVYNTFAGHKSGPSDLAKYGPENNGIKREKVRFRTESVITVRFHVTPRTSSTLK